MAFNTALSGLRASNQDLSVTGNNIANASTVGFKRSRAEFGDVYANSLIGAGGNTVGSGVLVNNVAQQFDQGNVSFTDNALDLAINGSGMFILSDGGARTYTRAGYFGLDSQGFIVSNSSARLQGYQANSAGVISTGVLGDLQIQTSDISPALTQNASLQFNLDSRESSPVVTTFDITDPNSFNSSTSMTVYDSQGNPHVMTSYFVKTAANTWDAHVYIDDVDVIDNTATAPAANPFQITFDTDGSLLTTTPATLTIDNWNPSGGVLTAPASNFVLNIGGTTQFGSEFAVSEVDQDGYAPGRLTGIEVDDTGVLFTRYTNGVALVIGQVTLADFANIQGLTPLGDTTWAESFESGQPIIGAAQSGSLGAIQSGALEESNVDLSEELVRLIIAQRNFQANAKTIETADTVTQAIINIR